MSTPDIELYCGLMEEIKKRIAVIDAFATGAAHAVYATSGIESACLQLRKCLEIVAMASLVANKTKFERMYSSFAKYWKADLLLRDLERVNPDFYPCPILEAPSENPRFVSDLQNRETGYLTKVDFVKVYKKCAAVMHASNPYGRRFDYGYYQMQIPLWRDQLIGLLNSHRIRLVNDKNLYLIHMQEDQDDKVHAYTFARQD